MNNYSLTIDAIKALRRYYIQNYTPTYSIGKLYQGNVAYSYFSITPASLKAQKLKFVLIFNHQKRRFEICLSGQNKTIRKKYWKLFKDSNWDKYRLAYSIDDSLSIMDHVIIENPNFDNIDTFANELDRKASIFMNELITILE